MFKEVNGLVSDKVVGKILCFIDIVYNEGMLEVCFFE